MIPERYIRLLTAYVDGELSSQQRKLAKQLLRRSSRARTLYKQLRSNAERLGNLPQKTLGPEFAPQVVASLPAAAATPAAVPARPASVPARGPWSNWVAAAVAASVLIAVASAAFMLFEPDNRREPLISKAEEDKLLPAPKKEITLPGTRVALGDPLLEKELGRNNALHLAIPCRHTGKVVAELEKAFKESGVRLLIDGAADISKGDFVVYAENLRVEELADILQQQRQFDAVFLNPLSEQDRQKLSGRLGVPADAFKAPPRAAIELKKMITKTGNSQPVAPSPRVDRFAVVLASNSPSASALSQELKHFVETRRQQPGTLQVMLVFHEQRA